MDVPTIRENKLRVEEASKKLPLAPKAAVPFLTSQHAAANAELGLVLSEAQEFMEVNVFGAEVAIREEDEGERVRVRFIEAPSRVGSPETQEDILRLIAGGYQQQLQRDLLGSGLKFQGMGGKHQATAHVGNLPTEAAVVEGSCGEAA